MTTISPNSHVYTLLTMLCYVGEYPLRSLHLLGSKEVWRKLILKHSQSQEYRISNNSNRTTCRLLIVTGKGKNKSVRISKAGLDLFQQVNPEAVDYFTNNYFRHNHAGEANRIDRFHRVAEAVAMIQLAGFETCPFTLPILQMYSIDKVVPDEPSFYISKELKYFGSDNINKISFSRITGALFYPGGCYAVYNSRDYLMVWRGHGESKVRDHLTKVARMNAEIDGVDSAILFGSDYQIADVTLQSLSDYRKVENRFDSIYDCLHFIPLDSFGVRLLKILTIPDWKEKLLDILFDPEDLAVDTGNFEYDAFEEGRYVISFLDSDIIRLNRFAGSITGVEERSSVICFPEQAAFVRRLVGPKVEITTVTLEMVEETLNNEGSDASE